MTAALITLAAVLAVAYRFLVHPVLGENRARRHHMAAADARQADLFLEPLRSDHDDYLRSLSLGLTEDPETFAARLASIDQARYTPAFLAELTEADAAAGHLDRTVPAARKEMP